MQEPLKYTSDCRQYVGYIIDHIPCLSIKTTQMMELNEKINDIWKAEFNNDINIDHLDRIIKNDYN